MPDSLTSPKAKKIPSSKIRSFLIPLSERFLLYRAVLESADVLNVESVCSIVVVIQQGNSFEQN